MGECVTSFLALMEELTTITNNAMKKEKYLTPETEAVEIKLETSVLTGSMEKEEQDVVWD